MYYIIDDQYNSERYCYAELYGDHPFTAAWLLSITAALRQFDGWGLGVNNLGDSYLLIFSEHLLVKGRLAQCKNAEQVVIAASQLLK